MMSVDSGLVRNPALKRPADEDSGSDGDELQNAASEEVVTDVDGQEQELKSQNMSQQNESPKRLLSFGIGRSPSSKTDKKPGSTGISIKLGSAPQKAAQQAQSTLKPKVGAAAVAFNDDDDEQEEMPPEAKMRMKNIGRDTPTSAGPNSFGKSRMGFCDTKKIFEKQMKRIQERLTEDD